MKQTENYFNGVLKSAGYKVTPARLALMEIFYTAQGPLGVHGIEKRLKTKINQTTVYRTIEQFIAAGIVREVEDLGHGHAHFELNRGDDHHHLVCVSCGKIEDIQEAHSTALEAKALAKSKSFTKVTSHSVEFFGLCKKCAAKK